MKHLKKFENMTEEFDDDFFNEPLNYDGLSHEELRDHALTLLDTEDYDELERILPYLKKSHK